MTFLVFLFIKNGEIQREGWGFDTFLSDGSHNNSCFCNTIWVCFSIGKIDKGKKWLGERIHEKFCRGI